MILANTDYITGKELKMLGADAIVNVRHTSSAVMQGAAEVMAYGTAVQYL